MGWVLAGAALLGAASPADAGRPRPPPPPLTSHDFNATCGVLPPPWSFTDPLGDGALALTGGGSGDAHLEIGVPAGTAHELGVGGDSAPRALRPTANANVDLVVKFDSEPAQAGQGQGLLLQGPTPEELIAFELRHDGSGLRLRAESFSFGEATLHGDAAVAGAPTLYLRVQRSGSGWTASLGSDGTTWTPAASFSHVFAIGAVGLYARNAREPEATSPGFTARVDFFENRDAPLAEEDKAPEIQRTLATQVAGSGSVQRDPDLASYDCGSQVLLTALPAPGYGFTGWSGGLTSTQNPLLLTLSDDLSVTAAFAPDGVPPQLSAIEVAAGTRSALVTWQTNEPATTQVAYGLGAGHELGSVGDTALTTSHQVSLGGLEPDRTYHYEITSVDGAGFAAQSGDATFRTASEPADLESADWNVPCNALPPGWSFVDPIGDGALELRGGGSGDAHLAIRVPAGLSHRIWTSGARAPRVVHAVQDRDFEVEARFESLPTQRFQGQGLLVEASPGNHLRFELYHDGTTLRIYAASFVANVPSQRVNAAIASGSPLWMRVARAGNQWTLRYSLNGASWTQAASFSHALAPSVLGVYAANDGVPASSSPAFTAVVDYVFDVAQPIVPEDDPDAFSAGDKRLDLDVTGIGSVLPSPDRAGYACSEPVTLLALPGAGQRFAGWSGDLAGAANPASLVMDGDRQVGALFVPDGEAPQLAQLEVTASDDAAVVGWSTDEPASSEVAYGRTQGYELGTRGDPWPKTRHRVLLRGLAADRTHHYRVSSSDPAGRTASSGDLSFRTAAGSGGPAGVDSDDFDAANLDLLAWSFEDPAGDASVRLVGSGSSDALALLDVPGGATHAVTAAGIGAPRLRQPARNVDFSLEARFANALGQNGQSQGLLAEESATRFLSARLELEGGALRLRASRYVDGASATLLDVAAPAPGPLSLRLVRSGSLWSLLHSPDGATWTLAGSFAHAMAVGAVAVFAGNSGGATAPPVSAAVDAVIEAGDPIAAEDGAVAPDRLPPLLQRIALSAAPSSMRVQWVTDEPATSVVRYGRTAAYELGAVLAPGLAQQHAVDVDGLDPASTYHFQVVSADALGTVSTSADRTATTPLDHSQLGPEIDVWYGPFQASGQLGLPQPWANVLGNARDPDGVVALAYRLNGGPSRSLRRGPDGLRLQAPGDFNADVPVSELLPGPNTVVITAQDAFGNASSATVQIDHDGTELALPLDLDWSAAPDLMSVAQPTDGRWVLDGDSVRNLEMGYDRLLSLGDLAWSDYEVTVPITVLDFDPIVWDPSVIGPAAAVGVLLRWEGHHDTRHGGPWDETAPYGAVCWYRIYPDTTQIEILPQEGGGVVISKQTRSLALGVPYVFKARVETLAGVGHQYSFKVWREGLPEPAGWDLTNLQPLSDSDDGSVLLVTHYMLARFGPLTVTPLP